MSEEIYEELKSLEEAAKDAEDLEDILSKAIQHLYISETDSGISKYGKEAPFIGHLWLSQFNCDEYPGCTYLMYTPSKIARVAEKLYSQAPIATLNLRKRTYSPRWNEYYPHIETPKELVKDTRKIMSLLGFKQRFKYKYIPAPYD